MTKIYVLMTDPTDRDATTELIDTFTSREVAERVKEELVGKPISQDSRGEIDGWRGNWYRYELEIEEITLR